MIFQAKNLLSQQLDRVRSLLAFEWRDLELGGDRPAIRLRAAATKVKRADELPLHPNLVEALAKTRPPFARPTDRMFKAAPRLRTLKGGWYTRKGKRRYMPGDLDRAGIAFEDAQGRSVDRHALRTTLYPGWGCTALIRGLR